MGLASRAGNNRPGSAHSDEMKMAGTGPAI
jgi:hypothetical protein